MKPEEREMLEELEEEIADLHKKVKWELFKTKYTIEKTIEVKALLLTSLKKIQALIEADHENGYS